MANSGSTSVEKFLGWLLFILGFILYTGQRFFSWFSFPTSTQQGIFNFMWIALIPGGYIIASMGFSQISKTLNVLKIWVLAIICTYAFVEIINGIGMVADASGNSAFFSGYEEGGYFFLLESATQNVETVAGYVNIVLACIPVIVVVITVVLIIVADDEQAYTKILFEGFIAILFIVVVNLIFSWATGVPLFQPF